MEQYQSFFKIKRINEVTLIDLRGLWTKDIAKAYHHEVLKELEVYKYKKVLPISNMVNWTLPPLEVMEITNQISQDVAQAIDFKHSVLLTQRKHRQLFEEVINQFNLHNTQTVAKAFDSLEAALLWGKTMGYDTSDVPKDYFG